MQDVIEILILVQGIRPLKIIITCTHNVITS